MSLIRDMLGITPATVSSSLRLNENVKKESKSMRTPGMKREVYSLCESGIPPQSITTHGLLMSKPGSKKITNRWTMTAFSNPARSDNLLLNHWVKDSDPQDYAFAKYNFSIKIPKYNSDLYRQELALLDSTWTLEETDHLWELCELYDLRFHVIYDRYNPIYNRSIEQIKKRYYSVSRRIIEYQFENKIQQEIDKHGRATVPKIIASIKDEKNRQPLIKFQYSLEKDLDRKKLLEKQYHVTEDSRKRESELSETLKEHEFFLKKSEKKREELKKVKRKFELPDDQLIPLSPSLTFKKPCTTVASSQLELVRSSIPKRLSEQVDIKMNLLSAKFPILFSQKVVESYCNLRTDVAIYINLQKRVQKLKKEKEYWESQISLLPKPQISTSDTLNLETETSLQLNSSSNKYITLPQFQPLGTQKATGKKKNQKLIQANEVENYNLDTQSIPQNIPFNKALKDAQFLEMKKEYSSGLITDQKVIRKQKRRKTGSEVNVDESFADPVNPL